MKCNLSSTVGTVKDSLVALRARQHPISDDCLASLIDYLDALQPEIERLEGGRLVDAEYGPNVIPFPLWRFPRHPSEGLV